MWYFIALGSTIIFAFYGILSTVLSVKSENPRVFSIAFNLIAGTIALTFSIFEIQDIKPISLGAIFLTLLSIFFYTIFTRNEFFTAKHVNTSTRYLFSPLAPLTTTIVAFFFYNEGFTLFKILGIFLILISNTISFINLKSSKGLSKKGFVHLIFTLIPLGIAWSIDKTAATNFPIFLYSSIVYISPALINSVFPRTKISEILHEVKNAGWKLFLLALFNVGGYYLLIKAFTLGEASKVSFVQSTEDVLAIILGILILKEKENVLIKITGGLIAFAGIILLRF